MPEPLLKLAFWDYDRTRAIADGKLSLTGYRLSCEILRPEDTFARAFLGAEFDICEISLANSATAISKGGFPYRLLPVFLSRAFRLDGLYVSADFPERGVEALRGRRLGLQEYDMTAAVVLRGILRDRFNITPSEIRWMVGEKERTKALDFPLERLPPGLSMTILDTNLSLAERLAVGEIDVLLSLNPPREFLDGSGRVRRLVADVGNVERDYLANGGVFPIMHALAIRASLLDRDPGLARAAFDLFVKAKAMALAELDVTQALKVTLPWLHEAVERARAVLGPDIWPYGLAANRKALENALRWLDEDGLLARPLDLADLVLDMEEIAHESWLS